ncbi:hypothetical protein BG418_05825 [Streptomyces sp. CBMA152]|nr:hypothetical protein [Streptomyces sp. CBMA152]
MPPSGMPVVGRAVVPGPPALRARSDAHRVADRGRPITAVHLQARHLATAMILAAGALAVFGIVSQHAHEVHRLGLELVLPVALVRSRTNGADFYEYGVDVKSGFVRRKVQFVWYYQIVESPTYVRTFGTYVTNTASLGLRYNEAGASSTVHVLLPGIGTPSRVRELGRYVESRAAAVEVEGGGTESVAREGGGRGCAAVLGSVCGAARAGGGVCSVLIRGRTRIPIGRVRGVPGGAGSMTSAGPVWWRSLPCSACGRLSWGCTLSAQWAVWWPAAGSCEGVVGVGVGAAGCGVECPGCGRVGCGVGCAGGVGSLRWVVSPTCQPGSG